MSDFPYLPIYLSPKKILFAQVFQYERAENDGVVVVLNCSVLLKGRAPAFVSERRLQTYACGT